MKSECAALLEKAMSKLKTARIDFDNGQFDDAVSRAYYAVFHAMSAALLNRSLVFSSHAQLIGAFNREFLKGGALSREYSGMIQGLFADRQSGDYEVHSSIDESAARRHIDNAQAIVSAVRTYLGGDSTA